MAASAASAAARRFVFPPLPVVKQLKRSTTGGMLAMPGRRSFRTRIEYLINSDVAADVHAHIGDLSNKVVLELSPGPGYLTRLLLNSDVQKVIAVEDNDFFEAPLHECKAIAGDLIDLVFADMKSFALYEKLDLNVWNKLEATVKQFSIVGVLPVAYADTVLHRLLRQMAHHAGYFGFGRIPLFLLLPSTAYNKATAQAGTLAYNKLAVMSRGFCKLTQIASYNVNNFSPLPKCESMVLCSVEPLEVPRINAGRLDAFEFIARQLFARRTVPLEQTIHTLGPGAEVLISLAGLDPTRKVNKHTVEEIDKLAEVFSTWPDKPVVFDAGDLGELVKESINRNSEFL